VGAKAGQGALSGAKKHGVDRHWTPDMPVLPRPLNRGRRGACLL
jgi:hypothetical protein